MSQITRSRFGSGIRGKTNSVTALGRLDWSSRGLSEERDPIKKVSNDGRVVSRSRGMVEMDSLIPGVRHYDSRYLSPERCHSLGVQLSEVMRASPHSVLEVGVGTGIAAEALRRVGIRVTTLDVQPALQPDVLGDVRAIPRGDESFDVSSCCQVLEHLPFDQFLPAVRELRRVTRHRLVLSVPDLTRTLEIFAAFSQRLRWERQWSTTIGTRTPSAAWRAERLKSMGHYWEIGLDGIRSSHIVDLLRQAGFTCVRTRRVRENTWHRFFIADVSSGLSQNSAFFPESIRLGRASASAEDPDACQGAAGSSPARQSL